MNLQIATNFINRVPIVGADQELAASFNPATGETLGHFYPGSAELANQAIAAARAAFDEGNWGQSPRNRAELLIKMGQQLNLHKAELIDLIVAENGKLRSEAEIEVAISTSECFYYAGLARNISGRASEVAPFQFSTTFREPAGVAAIIVPWNAPLTLLIRSLAPALAAGCTCVVKPAPQTPLIHGKVMTLFHEITELPPGVLNSVNESGAEVGIALTTSPDVDVVSFTGATKTGKMIMEQAAPTLKRLSLELGGKTPILVFSDADIERALPQIVRHCTIMAGQMCVAGSRILVHQDIFDQFKARIFERFRELTAGPGNDPTSNLGPVIDRQSLTRLQQLIDENQETILDIAQGKCAGGIGSFFPPTIVEVQTLTSPLIQEEHFGPICTLERFEDEQDAVNRANATQFGLAASIWSQDHNRLQRISRKIRFGSVWHNTGVALIPEAETGGFKQSGLGRLHGVEGLNDFLETKAIFADSTEIQGDFQ